MILTQQPLVGTWPTKLLFLIVLASITWSYLQHIYIYNQWKQQMPVLLYDFLSYVSTTCVFIDKITVCFKFKVYFQSLSRIHWNKHSIPGSMSSSPCFPSLALQSCSQYLECQMKQIVLQSPNGPKCDVHREWQIYRPRVERRATICLYTHIKQHAILKDKYRLKFSILEFRGRWSNSWQMNLDGT